MLIILSNCPRCERGSLLPKRDFKYKINYDMCLQCGYVQFDSNDGLGARRYRLRNTQAKKAAKKRRVRAK